MNQLSLEETRQIVDILFKEYISKIKLNGIKWELEFISHEMPNLCLKQLTGSVVKKYITGSCEIQLPFAVYYRAEAKSAQDILNLSKPLNDLSNLFYQEEKSSFVELSKILPANIEPKEIRMTSTPTMDGTWSNNSAMFKAVYTFRYKKGN